MATEQAIGTCVCGSWASLAAGLCSSCRQVATLPRDRLLTVPTRLLASGLPLRVRVLAGAGFGAARIAELLAADEADVRRAIEAGPRAEPPGAEEETTCSVCGRKGTRAEAGQYCWKMLDKRTICAGVLELAIDEVGR